MFFALVGFIQQANSDETYVHHTLPNHNFVAVNVQGHPILRETYCLTLVGIANHCQRSQNKVLKKLQSYFYAYSSQLYGCSRQCGRPVGAQCSMGFGLNPLINGLIRHTFKFNTFFV